MTRKTSKTLRKAGAVALSLALAVSTLAISPDSDAAAKKPALAKKSVSVKVKKTKTVKVKNVTKKNAKSMTVKSANKKIAKAGKIFTKKKAAVKATGVKKGSTKFTVVVKLKKKVAKKKKYTLKLAVKVTKATPTPTATPEVTPEPIPAEAITLDRVTLDLVEGETDTLIATVTPTDSTDIVEWESDAPEIASVDNAGNVTGVKAGTATITAKAGTASAECKVTVTEAEPETHLVEVKQTKANEMTLTFDSADAKTLVKKDDITIERADKLGVLFVNDLKWSDDNMVATATLSDNFADGVSYEITYGDVTKPLDASVGAVSSITINTKSAIQNIKTVIEYSLWDAAGVDVTSTVDRDNDIKVTITGLEGANPTVDLSKASAPAVTFTNVKEQAKVTVSYNPSGAESTVQPAEEIITCEPPQATVGNPRFRRSSTSGLKEWDGGANCANFYTGADDTDVKVAIGDEVTDLFFCAEDKEKPGEIISYEAYEVSVSNNTTIDASIADNVDSGKYAKIRVTGMNEGTANVKVNAIKNGVGYTYTIPVTVIKEKKLTGIDLDGDTAISNAFDTEYTHSLTVKGKYSDGTVGTLPAGVTPSFTLQESDKKDGAVDDALLKAYGWDGKDSTKAAVVSTVNSLGFNGFKLTGSTVTAFGAKAQKYTIQAAATDDDGNEIIDKHTVSVSGLAQGAWKVTGAEAGVAVTYGLEYSAGNSLNITSATSTKAKLAAYVNKQFAGYVRQNEGTEMSIEIGKGTDVTSGGGVIAASATTKITGTIQGAVKYGSQWSDGKIWNTATNFSGTKADKLVNGTELTVQTVGTGDKVYYVGNTKQESVFAKAGSYTVGFYYTENSKADQATSEVKVADSLAGIAPKATFTASTLDSLSDDDVRGAMTISCDMNNNDSSAKSWTGIVYKNGANGTIVESESESTKWVATYVGVDEAGYTFVCPTNRTLVTK